MRFAYSTINWGATPDFAAAFAEIREAGWRAVELFWHDLGWMGPPERMRGLLAGAGLTAATSFGLVRVPVDAGQLVRLRNEVAHAAALGATHYGVNGGDRLRWRPPDEAEEVGLARLLEELAQFGEAVGVQVAYHPHVACTVETEAEIARLLARTRRLSLCLDVSHIALVGEDPLAHLTAYRERTGYVHLKDWARGRFVEMGEGSLGIDFPAILGHLEATAFPGWVVVEQSRSDVSPARSAATNAAALRRFGWDPARAGDGAAE